MEHPGTRMTATAMNPRKTTWMLLVLLGTLAVWAPTQSRLQEERLSLTHARAQLEGEQQRSAAAAAALQQLREELDAERQRRDAALAEATKAEAAVDQIHPFARWSLPPATLPDWNPASPFVWLRKESLPGFPVPAFQDDGTLLPQVASVLMVGGEQLRKLNDALHGCLTRYRDVELSKVELTEDHLPGIGGQEGEKITIRVPALPEEGAKAKEEFVAVLTQALGEQRSTLLLKLADSWLDQQLSQSGSETKTISVLLGPQGGGNVSVKAGNGWLSAGFDGRRPEQLFNYVPRHLAPFFQPLLDRSASEPRPETHP